MHKLTRLDTYHLSDAHIKDPFEENSNVGFRLRLQGLLRHLSEKHEDPKAQPFSVIVFTGDITDNGKKTEYNFFYRHIKEFYRLLPQHAVSNVLFLAAPGNHDVCNIGNDVLGFTFSTESAKSFDIVFHSLINLCGSAADVEVEEYNLEPFVEKKGGPIGYIMGHKATDVYKKLRVVTVKRPALAKFYILDSNPTQGFLTSTFATGEIGQIQRKAIMALVDLSIEEDAWRFACMHHHPCKPADPREKLIENFTRLVDAKATMRILNETMDFVLTGHQHDYYLGPEARTNRAELSMATNCGQDQPIKTNVFSIANGDRETRVITL